MVNRFTRCQSRAPILAILAIAYFPVTALAEVIATPPEQGPYSGPPGFGRGMNTTMHCSNDPESWIRGSATLDKSTGSISLTVQLETDSVRAGPKGHLTVTIKDANGVALATASSGDVGMGGKPWGKSVIKNFSASVSVPPASVATATQIYASVACTGSETRLFNIDAGDVIHAASVVLGASQ
ncbi:hypothetical protein RPSD_52550 (plasmid) [Ralstonia solanacearum]|nr:hypothetical protein RPSD_52550 [Ralstonia solanacearum]